jgi:multisubunit Na+/H+ antiporter MnhB subunit
VLGGAVIVVDLSLLGLALGDEPLPRLSRDAEPWLVCGLIVTLASGSLLFLSEATKFYSAGFWDSAEAPFVGKMGFLLAAIVFTFTVRRRILCAPERIAGPPSLRDRLVGVTSLLLWLGVGVGGRAIGFY